MMRCGKLVGGDGRWLAGYIKTEGYIWVQRTVINGNHPALSQNAGGWTETQEAEFRTVGVFYFLCKWRPIVTGMGRTGASTESWCPTTLFPIFIEILVLRLTIQCKSAGQRPQLGTDPLPVAEVQHPHCGLPAM
jgi:hypothetical protein